MLTRVYLLALALGLAVPVAAQRAAPASPYELGADPDVEADRFTAGMPGAVALDVRVPSGAPAEQARAFLAGRAAVGARSATPDLAVVGVRAGAVGSVVMLRQTVSGVPVWGAVTAVTIDRDDRVRFVAGGVRQGVEAVDTAPTVTEAEARAAVLGHLDAQAEPLHAVGELTVWPARPARLAWRIEVIVPGTGGLWEGIVDAHSGALLRVADRAVRHREPERPTALPLAEHHPAFRVDGTGYLFDPDPNTRAGVGRDTPGYRDADDADSPELTAARTLRTLRDLTFAEGTYRLVGPWAEVQDWDAPFKGLFHQPSSDFDFTRSEDAFEAVTAYWHLDNYLRYVNETLGVAVRPYAYDTGVRFDPSALDGADNSDYLGGSFQRLRFGEGCVDDAEDADVILHELGHGLHHWLVGTGSGPSNADGLSEGLGDYVANSYTRSLALLSPDDPAYDRVFRWDGWYSGCWQGRRTDLDAEYPAGAGIYAKGQHWSTSLLRVRDVLGGQATDRAVFEGIAMTTPTTTQPEAAQAVLQAAAGLGYADADVRLFFDSFVRQGFAVTLPGTDEEEETEISALVLSDAVPNPFSGRTAFEVLIGRRQNVRVEVFDALGRRVAQLFDGEMAANQRYPFALDAASLGAGVYVYRVTGQTVSASRRVTLTR